MLFPLALLAALPTLVFADIEFTSPKAGSTLTGGGSLNIEWKDSGDGAKIADLTTYKISLCAGGNEDGSFIPVLDVVTGASFTVTGNQARGAIDVNAGASLKNAYFLKIESTAAKGGAVINYSDRFSISDMKGSFPQNVIDGAKKVTGTDGPAKQDNTNAAPANPADGDFGVEYTAQTGAIRYAPMQPVPGTKITKKSHTPAYPTSSVKIATTFLPIPKQSSTMTKPQTFSVSSRENPAKAAPNPTDDMAKFLARWKD